MKKSQKFLLGLVFMTVAGFTFLMTGAGFAACPDDIVSYWKLDETAGSTYTDFIGDNNGTGVADPTPEVSGRVNGAQDFDGGTQGIDVDASHTFGWLGTESFSIEVWVKTDGVVTPGTNQILIGRDETNVAGVGLQWWVGLEQTTGKASFYIQDAAANVAALVGVGVSLSDGLWHHVVAVRDGSSGDNMLYVDGAVQGTAVNTPNFTAGLSSETAALNIGYLDTTNDKFRFAGLIDEVALYDRALSLNEIQAHNTAGAAGNGVASLRPEPVAVAAANPSNAEEGATVTLDGSGSSDANGTIVTYLWEQVGTSSVTLTVTSPATATFIAPAVDANGETLTFRLTVTDNDGLSSSDTVNVTVNDSSVSPPVPPPAGGGDGGGGGCFINTMF